MQLPVAYLVPNSLKIERFGSANLLKTQDASVKCPGTRHVGHDNRQMIESFNT
jgi:hypothetical protein